MPSFPKSASAAILAIVIAASATPAAQTPLSAGEAPALSEPSALSQAFVAAMRRVHLNLPEPPDSPALQAYAIYDYLIVARLRRDLSQQPGTDLDATIDAFLQTHAGEPVARALHREWLASLAERRRWDWFLPR
ncbi:MAG: hypothetical protein ABSF86_12495, partial [Steroidobacteraceae bacterium]